MRKMVNMISPSSLLMVLSSLANMYRIIADRIIKNMSMMVKFVEVTLPNKIIGNPKTKPMLKMLVPTMLPRIISNSPFLAEVMARIISGDEVPITRISIVISF